LIVPSRTPTLLKDAKDNGLDWSDLGGGYWELASGPFTLYVAEIDIVAEREDDDLLRLFGQGKNARWRLDASGPNKSERRRR